MLDPSTRTAQIEIEIENSKFRLKPGMYANVDFTTDRRDNSLVVPTNAVVDLNGNRGVFLPGQNDTATFKPVTVGMIDGDLAEVSQGLAEGDRIVTTGAAALRDGDRIILAGRGPEGSAGNGRGGRTARPGSVAPPVSRTQPQSGYEPAPFRPTGGRVRATDDRVGGERRS